MGGDRLVLASFVVAAALFAPLLFVASVINYALTRHWIRKLASYRVDRFEIDGDSIVARVAGGETSLALSAIHSGELILVDYIGMFADANTYGALLRFTTEVGEVWFASPYYPDHFGPHVDELRARGLLAPETREVQAQAGVYMSDVLLGVATAAWFAIAWLIVRLIA